MELLFSTRLHWCGEEGYLRLFRDGPEVMAVYKSRDTRRENSGQGRASTLLLISEGIFCVHALRLWARNPSSL